MTTSSVADGTWLASLDETRYVSLETYRSNGAGVRTPVWFAEHDERLYVRTFAKLGKVRRVRRDPTVRLAPCDRGGEPLGEWREGRARLLQGGDARQANRWITRRLGWVKRFADLIYPFRYGRPVLVEIQLVPPRSSAPG